VTLTVFGIGVSGIKFLVVFLILIGFVCAEDSRKGGLSHGVGRERKSPKILRFLYGSRIHSRGHDEESDSRGRRNFRNRRKVSTLSKD